MIAIPISFEKIYPLSQNGLKTLTVKGRKVIPTKKKMAHHLEMKKRSGDTTKEIIPVRE